MFPDGKLKCSHWKSCKLVNYIFKIRQPKGSFFQGQTGKGTLRKYKLYFCTDQGKEIIASVGHVSGITVLY